MKLKVKTSSSIFIPSGYHKRRYINGTERERYFNTSAV